MYPKKTVYFLLMEIKKRVSLIFFLKYSKTAAIFMSDFGAGWAYLYWSFFLKNLETAFFESLNS